MRIIYRNNHIPLTIYSKFPSIGFKYGYYNEYQNIVLKRFQISFNSAMEFQSFIGFLHDMNFNIKDEGVTTNNYIQPSSQFVKPIVQPIIEYGFNQSQQINQTALDFAALSQPIQPLIQQDNTDYLSQILNPKGKQDISDDELKKLLNEKLRDMNFINFVSNLCTIRKMILIY